MKMKSMTLTTTTAKTNVDDDHEVNNDDEPTKMTAGSQPIKKS